MNLVTIVMLAAVSADAPGPVDAFIRNYRETHVSAKFKYKITMKCAIPSSNKDHTIQADWQPSGETWLTTSGLWESDGDTEHILLKGNDIEIKKPANISAFPYEMLSNLDCRAYHRFDDLKNAIVFRSGVPLTFNAYGGYSWWNTPFLEFLTEEYRGVKSENSVVMLAGRKIHRVSYTIESSDSLSRLVLNFDPEVGYLPRYIRAFSCGKPNTKSQAIFKEMYLISAKPCAAGGFVPTEWADSFFAIDNFDPADIKYDNDSILVPSTTVQVGHFKINEFANLNRPVVMDQLTGVAQIAWPAGVADLPPNTRTLTLPQIVSLVKKSNTAPERLECVRVDSTLRYRSMGQ